MRMKGGIRVRTKNGRRRKSSRRKRGDRKERRRRRRRVTGKGGKTEKKEDARKRGWRKKRRITKTGWVRLPDALGLKGLDGGSVHCGTVFQPVIPVHDIIHRAIKRK
jgi:hypothetical protein